MMVVYASRTAVKSYEEEGRKKNKIVDSRSTFIASICNICNSLISERATKKKKQRVILDSYTYIIIIMYSRTYALKKLYTSRNRLPFIFHVESDRRARALIWQSRACVPSSRVVPPPAEYPRFLHRFSRFQWFSKCRSFRTRRTPSRPSLRRRTSRNDRFINNILSAK